MTPKEFAVILRNVQACHEASYDETKHRYRVGYREAARQYAPAEWATIVACLLVQGYSDIWEWCDEVEAG